MFFLLFIIIPLIEVILFITIGKHIGLLNTIIIILITGIIGAFLVKNQGITILNKAAEEIKLNKIPIFSIFEGIAVFVAGAFLLTPGFFTDTLGVILLIPKIRNIIIHKIIDYLKNKKFNEKTTKDFTDNNDLDNNIVEGNFEEIDENEKKK
tara:strand:- start:629 stop:1084 length:456 start_codon:yes stop_codon:yes gene_type:complete